MEAKDIKILDKNLANMIAAGEVVERPASVVKELVENAIDAGANELTVEIKNGGKTYIRVTDNGSGMTLSNAKKAFLRHATSKISHHSDIFCIKTMGFRGEALAAISSVSKVELFTSTVDDAYGTHLILEAGDEVLCEEAGLAKGTTIIVRDLFYNTPARYNFLKKDSTETANIVSIMQKLALCRPGMSVRLIVDGKNTLLIDKGSNQVDVIYSIFGKEISDNLIQVKSFNARVLVEGYIGKPRYSRSNRNYQLFFVNGRYIKSKAITAALDKAYKNLLMNGKYAVAILFIDIDPAAVDVNIHPTKMEVKFSNESLVFEMVHRAVTEGLDKEVQFNEKVLEYSKTKQAEKAPLNIVDEFLKNLSPDDRKKLNITEEPRKILSDAAIIKAEHQMSFAMKDIEDEKEKEYFQTSILPKKEITNYSPSHTANLKSTGYYQRTPNLDLKELSLNYCKDMYDDSFIMRNEIPYRYVGELFKTYIIIESGNLYYLVDKHAAHERILFNKIYERYKKQNKFQQGLIEPIAVSLSPEEADIAHRYMNELSAYGYSFSEFGDNDVLLRTVPFVISPGDTVSSFIEMIEIFNQTGEFGITEYENKIMKSLACKAAIKAGFDSSDLELESFIKELIYNNKINYCPHGRPIICEFSRHEIEKAFKRKL